jgi:nucleoside-diphosphate-sugar epimerase
MRILIIGGSGMVGTKLIRRLAETGRIGKSEIAEVKSLDVVTSNFGNTPFAMQSIACDFADKSVIDQAIAERPDLIFHLAAIVSGEAEADFDKGYRINLEGTQNLLDAIRHQPNYLPKLVFTSSIAVFGAPFPESIPDTFYTTPLTSYGTHKAIAELLINDFTRRGILDGISVRLPTICVRPGLPNKAASGFFSNIIREPLVGKEAILPVTEDVRHWHASPRSAIQFLIHAATMDSQQIGPKRNITLPGVSVTVGEQIDALRKIAGEKAVSLIHREKDEAISRMVSGWATRFDATRGRQLGFVAESNFEEIIRVHVEDELGGNIPVNN